MPVEKGICTLIRFHKEGRVLTVPAGQQALQRGHTKASLRWPRHLPLRTPREVRAGKEAALGMRNCMTPMYDL